MTGYHVAPASARARIQEHGLIATGPNPRWSKYGVGAQPHGVYFWLGFGRALQWAADMARLLRDDELGACDIWRVTVDPQHVDVDPVLGDQGARFVPWSQGPDDISLCLQA